MATRELSRKKIEEIKEIARRWGKLLAREAYPDGPGLDVSLAEMEEIAVTASRGMIEGAVEDQAEQLGEEGPCPTCGKLCKLVPTPTWRRDLGPGKKTARYCRRYPIARGARGSTPQKNGSSPRWPGLEGSR